MYDLSDKKRARPFLKRNKLKQPRKPLAQRLPLRKMVRAVGVLVTVAFVIFLGVELYTLFFRIALLKLERVEVSNIRHLTREEVTSLAGVATGDDMLRLSPRQIGQQLEKSPWVESVRVRRYFPHTLAIDITEREPVAIVNMGYLYYLDRRGKIFKPLMAGDPLDYPVLTGVTEEDLAKDPKGTEVTLQSAVAIASLLKGGSSLNLEEISEIKVEKGYGFTLVTMRGGVPIRLGNDAFKEKLDRLARIYRELQGQTPAVTGIDLDYNDRIIVKRG